MSVRFVSIEITYDDIIIIIIMKIIIITYYGFSESLFLPKKSKQWLVNLKVFY